MAALKLIGAVIGRLSGGVLHDCDVVAALKPLYVRRAGESAAVLHDCDVVAALKQKFVHRQLRERPRFSTTAMSWLH